MSIEELTKSQIVLLTLLVSFITSIATGIVTVSLFQQAPPSIVQNVSRVIEETVQTVAPVGQSAAAQKTQEKTIVVDDSNLVSAAVARASVSLVRIYTADADVPQFLGLGVVIGKDGTIAADSSALADVTDANLTLQDGSIVRAFIRKRDGGSGIAYLIAATSTTQTAPNWQPIAISTAHPVLGESIIALSGKSVARIAPGVITALVSSGVASTSPQVIETNISGDSILAGSPTIDLQGALVGLNTGVADAYTAAAFMSALAISGQNLK